MLNGVTVQVEDPQTGITLSVTRQNKSVTIKSGQQVLVTDVDVLESALRAADSLLWGREPK